MTEIYVSRKKVIEVLGIHYQTIYNLVKQNKIETMKVGRISKYNLNKYLKDNAIKVKEKRKICYCRVSSQKQNKDLIKQIEFMKKKYPSHEIISDIDSGLNLKRKGLLELINYAIKGEIEEVVITYKDRLASFGYELIESLLKECSNASIKIINKKEEPTPTEELTDDIISIMNIYIPKVSGLKKYEKKIKELISEECANN